MQPSQRGRALSAAAVLLSACGLAVPAGAQASASTQVVPGTAPQTQVGATSQGAAPPSSTLSFAVTLPLRDPSTLRSLITGVSTPGSAEYGKYLTPAEFDEAFAPTPSSVQSVEAYLHGEGISVSNVSANRTVIDATGPVANVEKAFSTTIGRYQLAATGRQYTSNESAVSLPASVGSEVLGVVGLDNRYQRTTAPEPSATPAVGGGPAGGYTPSQLSGAYDVGPLTSAGDDGTGQNVGLFELAGYEQSDIDAYDSQYGISPPAPTVSPVDGGNSTLGDAEVEVELDIEVVQAMAPGADVTVFEAPNSDQGVIDAYNAMATSDSTATNSTSWGECEADSSSSTIDSEDQIYQQMASQGQTLFAAAGDSAAYDCGTAGSLGVDNPADDPYVTGAGGTALTISGNAYGSEKPWDTSSTEGGGGGVSTEFANPSWQTGDGVPSSCASARCVPDVSADADPSTGYSIYTQGGWTVVGGTSAAAPLWAGIATDYDEDAADAGKAALGDANPMLYAIADSADVNSAFHDITTGHTSTSSHWPAKAGYDMATGIGSPDAAKLAGEMLGRS